MVILCTNLSNDSLQAYKIDNSNYLLYSDNNDFCGILLKNLSEKNGKRFNIRNVYRRRKRCEKYLKIISLSYRQTWYLLEKDNN